VQELDYDSALAPVTGRVLALLDRIPTPIVLIDGRAGAGKSSFANDLRNSIFKHSEAAPTLIHMDDLYPGWDGLREGSLYLQHNILQPLSSNLPARWQVWDWGNSVRGNKEEPGNGWREFAGGNVLIVEGCGSLSRANKELVNLAVWIEADQETRRQRFSQRDEGQFDEHWNRWAAQEDEFLDVEQSQALADLIIRN
jgi:uridine kinase